MDLGEELEGECAEEKDGSSGSVSLSGSFGSSLSSSQDFRRQMKPPNKKKHEEEMEELMKNIRTKEAELRSLGVVSQEVTASELQGFRGQREVAIGKRKKLETDLRTINQEITRKMGLLSRTESNLHYKNEAKIDDAIRNMEWQLESQNFSLKEERKIVAEIDKLKRSKKTLQEYFTQKKEVDKLRDNQRRTRAEKDNLYKIITKLKSSEEDLKKSSQTKKAKSEILRKELNELHEKRRQMITEFKQQEAEYQRALKEKRNYQRKESFRKKEEDRKAKEQAWKKERLEYESQREPFEDEKNLCNTLISYLQRYTTEQKEDVAMLPSPRDEQPDTQIGASLGPADSLDDGMLILLKKSENENLEYSVASKKTQRRSRKGRKLSVTKPLAHTPQIISQFSSLTLNAPSNMSEVPASIEQLQARKRYYEEQAIGVPRPLLGSLNSSFSSSGSMSSLESPLRERNMTWSYVVDVPPAIAENQTPSDAGVSAESGFHDMSRQVSKTESSESAADAGTDTVLEELIRQSSECGDGEHSRSSSDTITPEDHVTDDTDPARLTKEDNVDQLATVEISQGNTDRLSDYQSDPSNDNESNSSLVFEESLEAKKTVSTSLKESQTVSTSPKESQTSTSLKGRKLGGRYSESRTICESGVVDMISNYDSDFPPVVSDKDIQNSNTKTSLNAADCDESKTSDTSLQTPFNLLVDNSNSDVLLGSSISIVVDSYEDSVVATSTSQANVPELSDVRESGSVGICGHQGDSVNVDRLNETRNSTEEGSGNASLACGGEIVIRQEIRNMQNSPVPSDASLEVVSLEDTVTHL